jgi:L-ascorbate metabolism protein UlaG (beta-lactamase superfamily)
VIEPLLADDSLLGDIEAATSDQPDALHVWWLGQSGFLCTSGGLRVILDPYLTDSLTEKYAGTDKPHVRMTRRVVEPERLGGIAVVTSSHNHTDHLDAGTLAGLAQANPALQLVLPSVNIEFAANRLGRAPSEVFFVGIEIGQTREVAGIEFTAIPAAHDDLTESTIGFLVRWNGWTILHPGDTIPYAGMDDWVKDAGVDVALLPINGRLPERRVAGNLWGDEAARWAKAAGAKVAVPCHYDMFAFNTETPTLFETTCQAIGQPFRTLQAGERLTLSPT